MDVPPLVAVVTPVYNGARFLAETMACVQAQTYPRLVHVLLDNASTDATPEIIDSFSRSRVPVLATRNATTLAVADNWNAALRCMPIETTYVRLLCADDLMHPTAIAKKVAVAERDPAIGVVGCQWRADGLCGEELPRDRTVFAGQEIVRRYLSRDTMVLSGMFTLIRCSLARRFDPIYDRSMVGFDSNAHLKLLRHCDYGFVHEELVTWRRHDQSITDSLPDHVMVHLSEWLILLDRYGPDALGIDDYREARLALRRHYLRRMLVMRWKHARRELFGQHLAALERRGDPARLGDFADALIDWLGLLVRGKRDQVGRAVSPGG